LRSVYEHITEDDIHAYGLCTLDAQFLFDDKLSKYLNEIHWRVTVWYNAQRSAERLPPGENKDAYEKQRIENLNWINDQGSKTSLFATGFVPFLVHKQRRRAWWLRWPA
jgi:hypothetical protein